MMPPSNGMSLERDFSSPEIFPVFNLPVHLSNNYTGWLLKCLEEQKGIHVVTLNSEMVILAEQDKALADAIATAELVIPDGAGIIFYLRLHRQQQQRCPGIELAASLLERVGRSNLDYSICFYGGSPGTSQKAANMWQQKIPKLSIFTQHGYLTPEAEEQWRQTLQQKQPKIILVGLGVPRQEFWIKQNRYLCPNAIWIGVGGSFDIWAGNKTRAPEWLRNNNLEWLYRLYQEPWRWRRMRSLPQFFWRSLWTR